MSKPARQFGSGDIYITIGRRGNGDWHGVMHVFKKYHSHFDGELNEVCGWAKRLWASLEKKGVEV